MLDGQPALHCLWRSEICCVREVCVDCCQQDAAQCLEERTAVETLQPDMHARIRASSCCGTASLWCVYVTRENNNAQNQLTKAAVLLCV